MKKFKIAALLLGAPLVALLAVGCGSSDDSTTGGTDASTTLTKAEFVKQANAICAQGSKDVNAEFEEFSKENNLSETKAPPKDVQGLVDKLHTQKGITITQKTLPGANHFFSNDADLLLEECADYLDRRLAGELSDPRPKRLR